MKEIFGTLLLFGVGGLLTLAVSVGSIALTIWIAVKVLQWMEVV